MHQGPPGWHETPFPRQETGPSYWWARTVSNRRLLACKPRSPSKPATPGPAHRYPTGHQRPPASATTVTQLDTHRAAWHAGWRSPITRRAAVRWAVVPKGSALEHKLPDQGYRRAFRGAARRRRWHPALAPARHACSLFRQASPRRGVGPLSARGDATLRAGRL
ncbi:hypothetical protein ACTIVE_2708 [Actinomadura verrucosospora]|uniref:Uncharacterized protein n=1 Tax=Actinomadura verrucosospora TaxID=46165 RepID=A0A7D3VRY0_ACTVE|nr:hypothetical protein ACTIVE_2708 [Actinomadura verrucosospora]